jgi:DnaJ family protein C protein 27
MDRLNRTQVPPLRSSVRIKIISLGDPAVGKSCLIKRYCEQRFVTKYVATIGVDYGVKPIKMRGTEVRVNFWDLAGGEEYADIRNEFFKDAQGSILVFDVSNRKSFEALGYWRKEAASLGADAAKFVLCGNKTDVAKRAVSQDEASKFAALHEMPYFETSAKEGDNVTEMFHALFAKVVEKTGLP